MQPVLGNEPMLIELCKAFVANLRSILNAGMLVGAVLLAQELRQSADNPTAHEAESIITAAPEQIEEPAVPLNADRIRHWQNCTRPDYASEHIEACELEASEIYGPEPADATDTGFLFTESPVIFARLGSS